MFWPSSGDSLRFDGGTMPEPRHRENCAEEHSARRVSACAFAGAAVLMAIGSTAAADSLGPVFTVDRALVALEALQRGLDRHPSIKLAGGVAMIVPMLALLAAMSRFLARRTRAVRTPHPAPVCEPVPDSMAWIELLDRRAPPVAVGELVRIGKSDDCDLALETDGPPGMRAVIQRTSDREFILFDVSSGTPGIAVNGAPAHRYRLSDGDRIEIGAACVVFRTGTPTTGSRGPLVA
jgi:hypothetical protein